MTDRGLPIVDGAPACPFVAYEDDRDGRGQAPDHRHRCFAEPRPAPRALAHQEAYCLSSAFPVCPTFQDWARREAATARAAQLEPEPPPVEEPLSQSLPPRELDAQPFDGTESPEDLPPRRNPPRAWADPPPWSGDPGSGPPESAEPPPFLADSGSGTSADRAAAEAAAYGAASRGLAGSAADRLAGPYDDEFEVEDVRPPSAGRAPAYEEPPLYAGPDDEADAAYRRPAPASAAPASRPPTSDPSARQAAPPSRSSRPDPAASSSARKPAKGQPQDPSELFGPAWERPRRYEAYPSLRTRVSLPSIGGLSRIGVAAAAVVLAAVALFFVGPMLLGIGSNNGDPGGAPTQAVEDLTPTPIPTAKPDPTPQVYVVAKGDTMSKIARKFHVTIDQLLAANKKIKNPNRIKVGDEITIPVPEQDGGG